MCTTTRAGPGISWGWRVGSPVVRRPGTMFAPGVASSRKSFPIRHLSVTHGDACSRAFGEKPERPSLCRASAGPCGVRKGGLATRKRISRTVVGRLASRFTLHEVRKVRTVLGSAIPTPKRGERRSVRRRAQTFAHRPFSAQNLFGDGPVWGLLRGSAGVFDGSRNPRKSRRKGRTRGVGGRKKTSSFSRRQKMLKRC